MIGTDVALMSELSSLTMLPAMPGAASPPLGGVVRVRCEDFIVHELPMYDPDDAGEHLYLRLRKQDCSHDELVDLVARAHGVHRRAIGFAGMKDARAITEQTLSVHLPGGSGPQPLQDDRVQLVWAARHGNKLRRGHLAGNRFVIRLREVDPLRVTSAWRSLQSMAEAGVPNAFGPQRFGRQGDNHVLGRDLLTGHWDAIVTRLTAEGRRGRIEANVRAAAAKGSTPESCVSTVPARIRRLWVDSLQSAIFNAVLAARIEDGTWNRLQVDDLAHSFQTRRTFVVSGDDLEDPDTCRRMERHELSATGPLWGRSMRLPGDSMAEFERTIASSIDGGMLDQLTSDDGPPGARRPLMVPLDHPQCESGMDEHGPYVLVAFELPPGAYATTVLHAIMGASEDSINAAP